MTIVENKYIWYYKKVETTTIQYYNFYFQEGKEMSFCKYCGKQLQDGEVCTCQQAQQSAGAAQPQQEFNQQAGFTADGSSEESRS